MSQKVKAAIIVMAVFVAAVVSAFWLRGHGVSPQAMLTPASASKPDEKSFSDSDTAKIPSPTTESSAAAGGKPEAVSPASAVPAISPRPGEVLDYTADVAKFGNVATLRLQTLDRGNLFGKNTWHLQAVAHTENPLRMIFPIDDQFDSYSEAQTLASVQYEMRLNERGQKINSVQRMTTTGKEPAPANITEARVVPGTHDPLGLMQYLRTIDWSKKTEAQSPAYDGRKLYDVRATRTSSSEPVTVPAGSYVAAKIELHVFDNGMELKDAHFVLYLANDAAHTPVLLEAVLPFATAHVALVKSN